MQWFVKLLEKNAATLLKFKEDLPNSDKAARVSIQQLSSEMATLQKDFNAVVQIVESFPEKSSKFVTIMSPFLAKAKEDVEQMVRTFKSMEESYTDAVSYLGEVAKEMGPEEFFGTINKFAEAIEEGIQANIKAAADAEKAKRREESKVKRVRTIDLYWRL
jgi:hypothetical protein